LFEQLDLFKQAAHLDADSVGEKTDSNRLPSSPLNGWGMAVGKRTRFAGYKDSVGDFWRDGEDSGSRCDRVEVLVRPRERIRK
jgi:Neuraminidase (sialidase)